MSKDPAFLDTNWYCINDFCRVAPKASGNYAIFLETQKRRNKKLMYIGTAENLYVRINYKHEIFRTLYALSYMHKNLVVAYVVEIKDKNQRLMNEQYLIKTYKPIINGT